MIEVYIFGMSIMAGFGLFFLILAAGAHAEYRDQASANNVKFTTAFVLASVVWPLACLAAVGAAGYYIISGIYDAFKRF